LKKQTSWKKDLPLLRYVIDCFEKMTGEKQVAEG
jgi:hypothetical protein